jgi:hypothetical protein
MRRCWRVGLEFQPRDLWIGVYWIKGALSTTIYICLVPCFPIVIWTWEELR